MVTESMVTPFFNQHKVFIIKDGDLLTAAAQNAFLKIIEEPPEYAVFIIICPDAQTLLPTVRSRAITIPFTPVNDDIVRKYITEKYPDEPRVDFLVKYCAGIPEAADDIIDREDFEQLREDALSLVPKILSKNKIHAYTVSEYFENHTEIAAELYDMILTYLRDALVTALGSPEKIVNADKSDKIDILARTYPTGLLVCAIDEIIYSKKLLDRNVKTSATAMHAALKVVSDT